MANRGGYDHGHKRLCHLAASLRARVAQLEGELAWTLEAAQIGGHYCNSNTTGCEFCAMLDKAKEVLEGTIPPPPVWTEDEVQAAIKASIASYTTEPDTVAGWTTAIIARLRKGREEAKGHG